MTKKLWYIQQLDLFKELTKEKLVQIESLIFMKEYGRREVIFEPGDKDKVFIVKTGQVELYQLSPSGKKVIIERLLPGSIFGDLGTEGEGETFVEATTNSYVCSLQKDRFFTMISQYPELSEKLMKQLFYRLLKVEKRMSSVATDSAFQRLVKLLLSLGKKKADDSMEVSEKFTHEELAQMLGISRQTVTTIINQLEKKGLITRIQKSLQFTSSKLESLTS
ncbi:Crp/Fnr family transcriptional regulator [Candidatus Gottesmanbacteria bacterium]|nr:Crp/Fnr family transcriptional regulator [Candidatus Gottesmanbacteria bacterium]